MIRKEVKGKTWFPIPNFITQTVCYKNIIMYNGPLGRGGKVGIKYYLGINRG